MVLCAVLVVVWPHQTLKKLASELAATAKSWAVMDELCINAVCTFSIYLRDTMSTVNGGKRSEHV